MGLDHIGYALERGLEIDAVYLTNGWKYYDIESVERTKDEGVYLVTYNHNGYQLTAAVSGFDVQSLRTK